MEQARTRIAGDWWFGYPVFVFLLLWSAGVYTFCVGVVVQGSFTVHPHGHTSVGSYAVDKVHDPRQFWLTVAGAAAVASALLGVNLWVWFRHRRLVRAGGLSL